MITGSTRGALRPVCQLIHTNALTALYSHCQVIGHAHARVVKLRGGVNQGRASKMKCMMHNYTQRTGNLAAACVIYSNREQNVPVYNLQPFSDLCQLLQNHTNLTGWTHLTPFAALFPHPPPSLSLSFFSPYTLLAPTNNILALLQLPYFPSVFFLH